MMNKARQETDFATNSMKTPINSSKTPVNSRCCIPDPFPLFYSRVKISRLLLIKFQFLTLFGELI